MDANDQQSSHNLNMTQALVGAISVAEKLSKAAADGMVNRIPRSYFISLDIDIAKQFVHVSASIVDSK